MKKQSFEERKKKFEKVTSKEIPRVRKVIDLEKIISGKRKKTNYENSPNSKKNRVGRADYDQKQPDIKTSFGNQIKKLEDREKR